MKMFLDMSINYLHIDMKKLHNASVNYLHIDTKVPKYEYKLFTYRKMLIDCLHDDVKIY